MAVDVGKIAVVVLSYWAVSISMVFANKFLVGDQFSADISLFITWLQCIVTVILTVIVYAVGAWRRGEAVSYESMLPSRSAFLAPRVLLMSFCFVCMLSFNNMCLKYVGVSFYQIARSTTIIFVVIFSVIILKKSVSKSVVGCCALVASGFFLGIDQEKVIGSLSVIGVLFGVTSSVFIALTGIFTKTALEVVEKNELKLALCTNTVAAVAFVPVIIFTGQFSNAVYSTVTREPHFWLLIVCTGGVGSLLSWISAVQINITSPITHHISTNSKAILQTIIAVLYYSESKSALWWASVLLVVIGACSYALMRLREEKEASAVAAAGAQSLQEVVTEGSLDKQELINDSDVTNHGSGSLRLGKA